MYCTNCGAERADDATVCAQCGRSIQQFAPPEEVPNHIVQAILVSFCCFLPLGIVALVYAAQVNGKLAAGDVAGARFAADRARLWVIITVIVGLVVNVGLAGWLFYLSR